MKVSNLTVRSSGEVYALRIARSSGRVNHYFHFIMDFVWPIFHWLDNDAGWLGDKTVAISSMEPGPLFFDRLFLEIFGITLQQGTVVDRLRFKFFDSTPRVELRGCNSRFRDYLRAFGSLAAARQSAETFRSYLYRRFHCSKGNPKTIMLIERAWGEPDRGAARRAIINHNELKTSLETYCAQHRVIFRNIKLESMTFQEQFELFSRSGIVIGQNGAGLANAMWLTPHESSLIELAEAGGRDHFCNYCGDFEIDYTRLYFQAEKTVNESSMMHVDEKQVLEVVDGKLDLLAMGRHFTR